MIKSRSFQLSAIGLTIFILIFIDASNSFARQGAPGSAPQIEPKMETGGSVDWGSACDYIPLGGCRFPVQFKGCCKRRVQYFCGNNPQQECVQSQYDYCQRINCPYR